MKHILEMLIQSIQHAMSNTPQKEKAGYENKWDKKTLRNQLLPVILIRNCISHKSLYLSIKDCYDL
jgi:hypothetical protein